MKHWNAISWR